LLHINNIPVLYIPNEQPSVNFYELKPVIWEAMISAPHPPHVKPSLLTMRYRQAFAAMTISD
jgi:hypothetical protein